MAIKKRGFNLLRSQLKVESIWDKMYKIVNMSARFFVIITELIVIGCFAARVVIDREAKMLDEKLNENRETLELLKPEEEEIIKLQNTLSNYKKLWIDAKNYQPYVEEIYASIPEIYTKISFAVNEDGIINLNGILDIDSIRFLESKLKDSESFSSVVLGTYNTNPDTDEAEMAIEAQIEEINRISLEEKYSNIEEEFEIEENTNLLNDTSDTL